MQRVAVLDILRRRLSTVPDAGLEARLVALETHIKALYDHVKLIEGDEVKRSAEHAAMVDQLDRLYKRISARIARNDSSPTTSGESPLAMRRRLRGG
jgi:hypothetical protein